MCRCSCRAMRAHVVQPLSAMPGEPGGAELAAAVSTLGLQTWVSPLHIWHLLSGQSRAASVACHGCWQQPAFCCTRMPACCMCCDSPVTTHAVACFTCLLPAVEKAVRAMFSYLERSRSTLDGGISDSEAAAAAAAADEVAAGAAADPYEQQQAAAPPLVRPRSPKLLLSVGVSQVSLLWLVSCAALAPLAGWQVFAVLCFCQPVFTAHMHFGAPLPAYLIAWPLDCLAPCPDRHVDAQGRRSHRPWQRRRYGRGRHLVPPGLGHQCEA